MATINQQRRRLTAIQRQAQLELAVKRLSRLTRLQREYGPQLNEAGMRLLRASTFSAYIDCRALGLVEQAREILHGPAPSPDLPTFEVAVGEDLVPAS